MFEGATANSSVYLVLGTCVSGSPRQSPFKKRFRSSITARRYLGKSIEGPSMFLDGYSDGRGNGFVDFAQCMIEIMKKLELN